MINYKKTYPNIKMQYAAGHQRKRKFVSCVLLPLCLSHLIVLCPRCGIRVNVQYLCCCPYGRDCFTSRKFLIEDGILDFSGKLYVDVFTI